MDPELLERIRSVKRVSRIARAGTWRPTDAVDRVVLDADERYRRRITLTAERGTRFLLDLAEVTVLRDSDGLVLDDGAVVAVVAKAERLIEIAAENTTALARVAWHLGNRHTEIEICGDRLRMRRDRVLEEMLAGLGARLIAVDAPFEPERGAYQHAHRDGLGPGDYTGAPGDRHV